MKQEQKKKIVSLQANISDKPFNQKSPGHPEVGVLNCHRQTDRHTDGHCNSMTESAPWADKVKRGQAPGNHLLLKLFYILASFKGKSQPPGNHLLLIFTASANLSFTSDMPYEVKSSIPIYLISFRRAAAGQVSLITTY